MTADQHDLPRRLAALGVPSDVAEAAGEVHRQLRPNLSFERRKDTPAMPWDDRISDASAEPLRHLDRAHPEGCHRLHNGSPPRPAARALAPRRLRTPGDDLAPPSRAHHPASRSTLP